MKTGRNWLRAINSGRIPWISHERQRTANDGPRITASTSAAGARQCRITTNLHDADFMRQVRAELKNLLWAITNEKWALNAVFF